ncbi:MAG: methylated-DNA--[protein]-cysteine S-methyltransferase [Eubacteriales bacterium]|nr:methylated-DNA--[protein]-cysteine S-methyltransferase [Eubacteriales bacterium]
MKYIEKYESPIGKIILASDEESLTGLWFEGQKYFPHIPPDAEAAGKDLPVMSMTKKWLDIYFQGEEPDFMPALCPAGTPFRREVWEILQRIPYGNTMTYGEIGQLLAKKHGRQNMSAQAVGQAVGHNPVSILIPCHRVLGKGNALTGYAGGVEKKLMLLKLEKVTDYEDIERRFVKG